MTTADVAGPPSVQALYSDHHGWLRAWLRRRLGCSEQAADLAHDTFVRVLDSRQAVAAWREPRAYLTVVARNLMADHWRRQELERAWLEALALRADAEAPSPEVRWQVLETLIRIDRCLSELPALTRRIFLSSQLDGLVYADIARDIGMSVPTVKRHMSKAFLACLSVA